MTPIDVFNVIWLTASLAAFGIALFPIYARTTPSASRRILRQLGVLIALFAVCATSQHVVIMETTLAQIAATGIGRIWITQIVIGVLLFICTWRGPNLLTLALAGAELVGFAFIGHANALAGATGAAVEIAHLLAAGAWLGGAFALALALRGPDAAAAVKRFSWAGIAFVTIIGATGVLMLRINTGALLPITAMAYGQLALVKIILFAAALACAAFNRLIATPRAAWRTMTYVIAAELALLVAIITAAVLLAQQEPYG